MTSSRTLSSDQVTPHPKREPPTRARLVVLAFLCALAFVLYLDRVCMGQAVGPIQDELGLSNTWMGVVLMAFTLAYGLFEIPTGRWGDRFGSRAVLVRIVVWWSVFTALTGACTGVVTLVAVRFLFGAGEAGAYPNVARVIARWFPPGERGRVQGLFMASSLAGGMAAPVLAGYLIGAWGWRGTFGVFGLVGLAWAAAFAAWFRENPASHPSVNTAECELIGAAPPPSGHAHVPWRAALTNRNIWLLGTIISCAAATSYLYYSWYPKYLQAARDVGLIESGWLVALVLAGGVAGMLSGGIVVDEIIRRGADRARTRRRLCAAAFVVAAVLLLAGIACDSPLTSTILAAGSCLAMSFQQSAWWSCASEIGGRNLGALFGLLNMMGMPGAMASQFFFGAWADWREAQGFTGRAQWDSGFYAYAGLLLVAAVCWLFVDTSRPIGEEEHHPADKECSLHSSSGAVQSGRYPGDPPPGNSSGV
jgi:MFS family permease